MISLFRPTSPDPQRQVTEELETLIAYLKEYDFKSPLQLEPSSKPLSQIVNLLNQYILAQREAYLGSSLAINQVVADTTSMTCVREMLLQMQEQTQQLSSMAAQAEQMGAASNEIASAASSAATYVETSVTMASEGTRQIKEAVQVVEQSFSQFENVSLKVQEVLHSMGEIEKIVSVIAGVADQTNLLALNAAIEAARAGENGRGFAVVADEVRKLAEHTTESVGDIQKKIAHLSSNSHHAAESISQLSQQMQSNRSTMQGAGAAVEEIMQHIQAIASDINQIAAGSEEQSASIQEFTSGITTVAEAAEMTRDHAQQTGEGIYHLSQALGEIRLKSLSTLPDPSTYQALEFSKTDHYLWTWRIYNMLLGYEHIDPKSVGNHHECRLGRWADSPQANSLRSHPLFQKLEAPHKRVHDYAYQAALAYQAKDITKAEEILAAMSQASKEVVEILDALQHA